MTISLHVIMNHYIIKKLVVLILPAGNGENMKKNRRFFSVILIASLVFNTMGVFSNTSTVKSAMSTLLDTYGKTFGYMGVCVNSWQLRDSSTLNHIKSQYNSITLENEMKPDYLLGWSSDNISVSEAKSLGYYIPDSYKENIVPRINFNTVDEVMKICYENGLKMRGHTLVWHSQTPAWFFRIDYSENNECVDADTMYARMEMYIKTVMNHVYTSQYGSVVYAWDVANEYLHAENSGWLTIYGDVSIYPEFIKRAFIYANDCIEYFELQDSVRLFYNDYNTYMEADKIIPMINYINAEGRICDGVGMQSHLATTFPSVEYYTQALQAFVSEGFEVQITELDCTNTSETELADYYYRLMSNILEVKAAGGNITGITYWGLSDEVSWRSDGKPLLFSTLGNAKEPYYKVITAYEESSFGASAKPTIEPTAAPTATPKPTAEPTAAPTATPKPTAEPTAAPTATPKPTAEPTVAPTATPKPTIEPTAAPTATPKPTAKPTAVPTATDQENIKDKVYTVRKYTYQILSDEKGTVIITGLTKKNAAKIRIRDTVKISGKEYKIIEIKASAFKKCKNAKKIIIGKNVSSIGEKAFFKCKRVKNIYINSLVLDSVSKKAFGKIPRRIKVKLPNGRVMRLSKYMKSNKLK